MIRIAPRLRLNVLAIVCISALVASACGNDGAEPDPIAASPTVTPGAATTPVTPPVEPSPTPGSASTPTAVTADDTPEPPSTPVPEPTPDLTFDSVADLHRISDFAGLIDRGIGRWQQSVPDIEDIRLTSTADGAAQPALWLAPDGDRPQPLLVILHSWSAPYDQHAGIPYAMWAAENGWAAIVPQFRGVNDGPDALGSPLAVQDVVDAIRHATTQPGVDSERVYALGYSGGGMMALLLAGRHPDKVSAVAAWGPPADLIAFYRRSARAGTGYASDISAGCGGDPTRDEAARAECARRSPLTHLGSARTHGVAVYIGQGIHDRLVAPSQAARAFNALADPADRFTDDQVATLEQGALPDDLSDSPTAETFFANGDPQPVLARRSGPARLVYFDDGHDMVYGATLRWIAAESGT